MSRTFPKAIMTNERVKIKAYNSFKGAGLCCNLLWTQLLGSIKFWTKPIVMHSKVYGSFLFIIPSSIHCSTVLNQNDTHTRWNEWDTREKKRAVMNFFTQSSFFGISTKCTLKRKKGKIFVFFTHTHKKRLFFFLWKLLSFLRKSFFSTIDEN